MLSYCSVILCYVIAMLLSMLMSRCKVLFPGFFLLQWYVIYFNSSSYCYCYILLCYVISMLLSMSRCKVQCWCVVRLAGPAISVVFVMSAFWGLVPLLIVPMIPPATKTTHSPTRLVCEISANKIDLFCSVRSFVKIQKVKLQKVKLQPWRILELIHGWMDPSLRYKM